MIQIGTADYQSTSHATDPIECYDCGHSINVHATSGCYMTDRDGETLPCLCKLSPDDIGETIETDQEGTDQ